MDLRHAAFTGNLCGARFSDSCLRDADFSGAELTRAMFLNADLSRADFSGGNLIEANFSGAAAPSASFIEVNLRRAIFTGAVLPKVNFRQSTLREAVFTRAMLSSYISDEHNAKKIGNGVDLFGALPYHGTTFVCLPHIDIDKTHVYPESFVIKERDTNLVKLADGVSTYQDLPFITMCHSYVDSTSNAALSSAELAAMKDIIDGISTVESRLKKNVTIPAQTIADAFTAQSLDITDYSLLSESNSEHVLDNTQLMLMMIKSISSRLAVIEDALL